MHVSSDTKYCLIEKWMRFWQIWDCREQNIIKINEEWKVILCNMNNGDYVKLDHFNLHLYNSFEGRKPLLNMTKYLCSDDSYNFAILSEFINMAIYQTIEYIHWVFHSCLQNHVNPKCTMRRFLYSRLLE